MSFENQGKLIQLTFLSLSLISPIILLITGKNVLPSYFCNFETRMLLLKKNSEVGKFDDFAFS